MLVTVENEAGSTIPMGNEAMLIVPVTGLIELKMGLSYSRQYLNHCPVEYMSNFIRFWFLTHMHKLILYTCMLNFLVRLEILNLTGAIIICH